MTSILTQEEIIKLLKKYGVILISFDILSRFGLTYGMKLYYDVFPLTDMTKAHSLFSSIAINLISMVMNLIIAIVLLSDMDRRKGLTWIIFVMALFGPWMSVLFLMIWKVVEVKNNAQQLGSNEAK
ncbi:hypothetical protein SAMN06298216_4116 [Spirosomataceae bacterium TFI 002]|nr:hypothetical protein SAMN06298216_4116 [Spirosomataceae bacterium TFI 002]